MEDKPSLAERYIVATETSDLRMHTDRKNIADIVAAAGMSRQPGAVFERLRSEFDQAKAEVHGELAGANIGGVNERMLVMLRLKSLTSAKSVVQALSERRTAKARLRFAARRAEELAWQALSIWLDPLCAICHGTGKLGGYDGKIQSMCNHCDGGSRRGFVGKTEAERIMVAGLICDIEELVQAFEIGISHAMGP